ncbi:unnamed protein product [Aphanomyces euteiches]|uniref:Serine aminopeptidase S33 domain-containing protein n=1 Tax=Aphanomyces euteiches TaxID=100861 RepID=A0A6G0XW19_9STRA|nr:hypothetical protein Ae201684_001054 [Aphanomyces euteiches]KAH9099501.1 hypothetical protein Ae201684P_018514 [Aphanomyces euteiches]KAH9140165.1 hypothetical protein AeRB84_015548 [Aphanomyces euteiches]
MLWVAVAAVSAIAVPLAVLVYLFGPGHEDVPERLLAAPLAEEAALQAEFKHEAGTILQPGNVRVYTQYYFPKTSSPKAVVVYFHGINAHGGRLTVMYEDMLRRGYIVGALDFRGFGRSSGRLGFITDFADYVFDALTFLESTRVKFPGQKVFVLGTSMGGLILLHTLLKARPGLIDGSVLQAPPVLLAKGMRPPAFVEGFLRLAAKAVPKLPFMRPHGPRSNSKAVEKEVERSKLADPLFYGGCLRLGTALAIANALQHIQDNGHKIDAPFCLIHGEGDRVCAIEGSERFFPTAASKDKRFIKYPGGEHNVVQEPEEFVQPFLDDVAAWIEARL